MKKDPRAEFWWEKHSESTAVWVCQDWFPKGTYSKDIAGFPMNRLLKQQIDFMIKNVVDDWDFTLLICGEGEVRIGKSTLAQQISTYWTWSIMKLQNIKLPHSVKENMVFTGDRLIRQGNKLGTNYKYSSLIFDEAGADLEGTKTMTSTTKAVKDYLRECGQYNMLNILVLPEYFDLPKSVALSRSIAMINVYWLPTESGKFQRGFFKFYNKPSKKNLYIRGKKELNYTAYKESFYGQFPRFYTYDEGEYKKEKVEALKNREIVDEKEKRMLKVTYAMLKILYDLQPKAGHGTIRDLVNAKLKGLRISKMYIGRFERKMARLLGEVKEIKDAEHWNEEFENMDTEEIEEC